MSHCRPMTDTQDSGRPVQGGAPKWKRPFGAGLGRRLRLPFPTVSPYTSTHRRREDRLRRQHDQSAVRHPTSRSRPPATPSRTGNRGRIAIHVTSQPARRPRLSRPCRSRDHLCRNRRTRPCVGPIRSTGASSGRSSGLRNRRSGFRRAHRGGHPATCGASEPGTPSPTPFPRRGESARPGAGSKPSSSASRPDATGATTWST